MDHVAHLLVERGDLQARRLAQDLLEAQFVVDGLLRTEVRIGDQVVARFNEEVVDRREAIVRRRALRQDIVVREEDRLVRDVEREGDTWHDVHLRRVIFKGVRVQFSVRPLLQPRRGVYFVDREDVRVVDFRTGCVEPGVAVAVSYNGGRAVKCVHVDGVVVSDVRWDDDAVVELREQVTSDVTDSVILADYVGVFQNLLVRVETVNTHTDVEDDVVKRELIHHVARDVNRLVSLDGASEVTVLVFFVEEIFEGWATGNFISPWRVARVVHEVVALIQEVVCTHHVEGEVVGIQGVEVDEIVAVWIESQRDAQVAVKRELVVTDEAAVRNVERRTLVGDGRVVQVQLLDVRVGGQTTDGPQPGWREREERVASLLVFEAHLQRVVADVG